MSSTAGGAAPSTDAGASGNALLVLPATLTSREARDTQRMLAQVLRQQVPRSEPAAGTAAEVTVDASGLQRFDSAALAVLIECQRLAQGQGRGFAIRQAPAKLQELARLYGLEGLLPLVDTGRSAAT